MILDMILGASRSLLEGVRYNTKGALAGFVGGAAIGVGLAVAVHVFGSPDATLAESCVGLGALFALIGAVVVAQLTYHASGAGDPRVIDIPRRSKEKR